MKNILILIFILCATSLYSQEYSLLEINAKWNKENSLPFTKLADIRIGFAWLEDQPERVKNSVMSVPTLILMKNGRNVHQWQAGINLQLSITEEDIIKALKRIDEKDR